MPQPLVRVTDAGLKCLSRSIQLRRLLFDSAEVTDDGVARLQIAWPDCAILNLERPHSFCTSATFTAYNARMAANKTRRRWLSFGIRSLLLITTCCCIGLALFVERGSRQRRAVRRIEAVYGRVLYDFQDLGNHRFSDQAGPLPHWWVRNLGIDYFHNVVWIDLDSPLVTDETFASLSEFPHLKCLHVSDTTVTKAGLKSIGEQSRIEFLTLNAHLDETGLQQLQGMRSLQVLWLSGPDITEASLPVLKEMKGLRRLVLDETQLSDDQVAELQLALPDCEID
jgi:hypothetical protein